MIEDSWYGCYGGSLKEWIVPAAFSHPAKFSKRLIERIYAHCLEEGWLVLGSSLVLDPMAGVATGGVAAANAGLAWEGIELEQHFVEAGRILDQRPSWALAPGERRHVRFISSDPEGDEP